QLSCGPDGQRKTIAHFQPPLTLFAGVQHQKKCKWRPRNVCLAYYLWTLKTQWWPVFELHAQSQTTGSQHFLDFVQGLAAQVWSLQQFVFGTLDQIADIVDIFGFQAVCGTNSQFQIVDRTQQHRIDLWSATYWGFVGIAHTFQSSKHGDLIHQDASGLTNGFLGRDHAVGFDVQNQLVQVSTLFHTGVFDRVANTAHWAVRRVQHDTTDRVGAVISQGTNVTRHVATALLNLDLHFQLAVVGQGGNHMIGVDDFNVVRQFDVASQNLAGAFFAQDQGNFFTAVQLEDHALQVHQDINHVLAHAWQRGVLVHHTGN